MKDIIERLEEFAAKHYHAERCAMAREAASEIKDLRARQWQTIETAPKDGTSVILWVEGGGWYVGFWDGRSWTDGNYFDGLEASFWCHLPVPPKTGEAAR